MDDMVHHAQAEHSPHYRTEVHERREFPGTWSTELILSGGEVYLTVFHGPDSRERAEAYAEMQNAQ